MRKKALQKRTDERRKTFELIREMIRSSNDEGVRILIAKKLSPIEYTICNTNTFIAELFEEITLHSSAEYADVAELLISHNLIDYRISNLRSAMIGSNSAKVYIYSPEINVLIKFEWKDVHQISDLQEKIMVAFGVIIHERRK